MEALTDIDSAQASALDSWNSGKASVAMLELMKHNSSLTFADFEKRYRKLGSKTYLVAKPKSVKPPQFKIWNPATGKAANYWLWVCLHGEGEMKSELAKLGIAAEANLINLVDCGVLIAS